jgi:hypothetical protein
MSESLKLKSIRPLSQRSRSGKAVENQFTINNGDKLKNEILAKFTIKDVTTNIDDGGIIINAQILRTSSPSTFADKMKYKLFLFEENFLSHTLVTVGSNLFIPNAMQQLPFCILTFDSDEADLVTEFDWNDGFPEFYQYVQAKNIVPSSFETINKSKDIHAILVASEAIGPTANELHTLQLSISY